MKADPRFANLPKPFWAAVRSLSQSIGYTIRGKNQVKIPTINEIQQAYINLRLNPAHISNLDTPTDFANQLTAYFEHRAKVLNKFVEPRLMNVKRAKATFESLRKKHKPSCPLPSNKQKGAKKSPAFFTCIINILIEANSDGIACDFSPRELTTFTKHGAPLRTLARRIDGALPTAIDPVAIWEIKEYYYTTTFGSRVADGVYETLLDGMELQELREHENVRVFHYLMLDAYYTWWNCGKSYLCRIVDMLHMGYTDEVLFGYEVVERLPGLVKEWVKLSKSNGKVGSK